MLVCAAHTLAKVYPDPAPDCVGKQDEVGCREARAGGWQCRDPSACRQDGLKCSDSDVARRIGMSCSGWPGYNGGYPISKIHWDSENEYYECDTVASQKVIDVVEDVNKFWRSLPLDIVRPCFIQ